jgi:hypothetical protein
MKPLYRGIAVALLHCFLVLSIAGKYAIDRARLPRVWVRTVNYDPDMPIRGRYVNLRLIVDVSANDYGPVRLSIQNGRLVGVPDSTGEHIFRLTQGGDAVLFDSVPYFLPEHAPDPTRRTRGEELWVEVSVPRKGPPRPIRLGVKRNGTLTPLDLR